MLKDSGFIPPVVGVAESEVSVKGFADSSLNIILRIQNPNKVPIIVTKIQYIIYGNDNVAICEGNITKQIIIQPNAAEYIPIRVKMRYATLKAVWDAMEMDKIEWKVIGQIYIKINDRNIIIPFRG